MLSSRTIQRWALALNLVGASLLFFSFQATSSDFRLVTVKPDDPKSPYAQYSICVGDFTIVGARYPFSSYIGEAGCPSKNASRAAIVNIEHPSFTTWGFSLTLLGFLVQFFTIPKDKSLDDLRRQIKEIKAEQKLKG